MSRVGILLLLALAALAQASVITNSTQGGVKPSIKTKLLCKPCEKIFTGLKKVLDNPDMEAKLIKDLKALCDFPLFGSFKQKCLDIANNIVFILHEVQGEIDDPQWLCESLKLCATEPPSVNTVSKKLMLSVMSKFVQEAKPPSPINAIDTCGLCTSALDEFKRILDTPEVVEKVQSGLEQLCKYAGKYQVECNQAIEAYLPKIVQIIEDVLCDPEETCKALKLCKGSQIDAFMALSRVNPRLASMNNHPNLDRVMAKMNTSVQTSLGINVECFACKAAIGTVIDAMSREKVLTMIVTDATNAICKLIPSTLKAGCFDFLGIYAKAAIQLTLNEWTPAEICTAMRACTAVTFQQQIQNFAMVEKSAALCDACEVLTKILAFELQQPAFQQDIINVLTKGCLMIPGKYGNKVRCESIVDTYIPYMLENIVALSVPRLCSVVHMC